MCLNPQRTGCRDRIDHHLAPPCRFVTVAMKLAMMSPTQRHGELVADFAPERPALSKAQMMGIARPPAAQQTGLPGHVLNVLPITDATRLGESQETLVDS
jgi:hypothetical protein